MRDNRPKASDKRTTRAARSPVVSTTIGTIGGISLAPLIVWITHAMWDLTMPAEAAAALGALIAQIANYPLLRANLRP